MKRKITFTAFFISVLAVLWCSQVAAQTGSITGTVYENDGRSTLPGSSVYLKEDNSIGTVAEVDGTFILTNIPVGKQVVVISFTGFETKEVEVEVLQGTPVNIEVELGVMAIMGEEVTVTAQALGQAKAINQQLNSDAIANFVSADKIKELPDVNAAEAISRLPGVAINRSGGEGSKIVVRGLDPKFTAISINGVRLPSSSGTDRSVDLSLISPELLSGIELFKSPTPDMDGDALGGSVNLNILRAPKERKISIKGLGGYNDLGKAFTDYKATASIAQRVMNGKLGIIATGNIERFNRGGEIIGQGWGDNLSVVLDTLLDIFKQEGNYLQFQKRAESRKRYNGSLGFDFGIGGKTEVAILGIYSRTSRDQFNTTERYDVNNNRITYIPRIIESSIELFSGSISARHNLNILDIEWGGSLSQITGETPYDFEMEFRDQSSPFNPSVYDRRDKPQNFYDFIESDPSKNYLQGASSVVSGNKEEIASSFLNINIPLRLMDNVSANFKFGGKIIATTKERTYNERFEKNYYLRQNSYFDKFEPEGVGALGIDPTGAFYYNMSNFTNNNSISFVRQNGQEVGLLSSFEESQLRKFKSIYENDLRNNRYSLVNNYDLQENVYATYAMLKLKVGNTLTFIPGFRYEYSDNTYSGIYSDLNGDWGESGALDDVTEGRNYGLFLPHLHIKYKPLEWFDLRASYSTTLARPDFDYVVPFTLVNRSGDLTIREGNPELNPSVSTNYDLYATAYSGKWGLLSVGAFYKDIKDAFYPFIVGLNNDSLAVAYGYPPVGFGGAELTTFSNSPNSNVKGIEVDLQSNMNFLPKPFDGLVLNLNYTRLFSETTINSFYEESYLAGTFPFIYTIVEIFPYQREVKLIGQAKHIFNASLGFDYRSFSVRFSTSYQGAKLSGYSSSADKDQFNQGFWRFDAALKQKFGDNLRVFLNLNNLSDQKDINFFRSEEFVTSISRFGATATIGAEYIFR
ncbi:MAG: TonB-dependent receptor [Lewinellaceae bacterium]|nr:TonB-dependent receptor [Lewinellaceae bacterium]